MTNHIIAIHTYGSQRIKHPRTKQVVSAHKIGYSSAAPDVLLALYGTKANDVSSKQASYRYIQIDGETSVRHGYLLLNLTTVELARAEAVTRQSQRAAVYRWHDNRWLEFPHGRNPAYSDLIGRSGPDFDPSGYRPVSPTTGEKETAVEGIRAEKSQRSPTEKPWFWLLGETYPHRETLKRYGARFSSKRRAWYYTGWDLPEAIQQLITASVDAMPDRPTDIVPTMSPALQDTILEVLGGDNEAESLSHPASTAANEALSQTSEPALLSDDTETPPIRVIQPAPFPIEGQPLDAIRAAIVQAKSYTTPVLPRSPSGDGKRTLRPIGQACVGELTGSISGNVYCFGYAIHDGICVFLNMGGPRTAVEAIRAKLSKGDIVSVTPWDGPAVELTAGEGNTGLYHDFFANIPEAKFTSLILCHDWLVTPNYGGKVTTFIIRTDEAQAIAKLKHHVTELVKIPVFEDWAGYLYHAGQTAMLVRPTRAEGGIDLLTIDLDVDAWTRLITGGLANRVIVLPNQNDV
jgi:hypothetical protein